MNLLTGYTPAEARALENHVIAGYIQEGIFDRYHLKVKAPVRGVDALDTKREQMKVQHMNQSREKIFKLVQQGHSTVNDIRKKWPKSETAVRRYLRELEAMERVEAIGLTFTGAVIWRVTA